MIIYTSIKKIYERPWTKAKIPAVRLRFKKYQNTYSKRA